MMAGKNVAAIARLDRLDTAARVLVVASRVLLAALAVLVLVSR